MKKVTGKLGLEEREFWKRQAESVLSVDGGNRKEQDDIGEQVVQSGESLGHYIKGVCIL